MIKRNNEMLLSAEIPANELALISGATGSGGRTGSDPKINTINNHSRFSSLAAEISLKQEEHK